MRVKLNSASSPVPSTGDWHNIDDYSYLHLFDAGTGWGIGLVFGPRSPSLYGVYILTPNNEAYDGPIYDCPFDLAVELMETYYIDAETGYYRDETMFVDKNIATHIVRVMAPGRGLMFGT